MQPAGQLPFNPLHKFFQTACRRSLLAFPYKAFVVSQHHLESMTKCLWESLHITVVDFQRLLILFTGRLPFSEIPQHVAQIIEGRRYLRFKGGRVRLGQLAINR